MRITFERSGGIMGAKSRLEIDLNQLSANQAEVLRKLLEEANFFALPENPQARAMPDGFQYTITVEAELVKHTVHTSDGTVPPELGPLLQELSQRVRRRQ
ncbi:MAG: hypothetical protein HY865_16475 [Chloroflexi bacterium]|nr:hypothetical protein [Chloroflexota bacterium]